MKRRIEVMPSTGVKSLPYELVLTVEDTLQQVVEKLNRLQGQQVHSVLLVLAKHGSVFQNEEDFVCLRQLQKEFTIPIVAAFVIPPGNEEAAIIDFAFRQKFRFARTREAALQVWHSTRENDSAPPLPLSAPSSPTQGASLLTGRARIVFFVLALLVVFAAIGEVLLLPRFTTVSVHPATHTVVGQVAFVNGQQGGINNEVQVRLPILPKLSGGKVYTVWLMSDQRQSDTLWLSLGRMNSNSQEQLYTPNRSPLTNLLATYSQLCITASSLSFIPTARDDCKYYGKITQTPNTQDTEQYSLLDHVRHLLASDPTLERLNIHNGLIENFSTQISKINEWASASVGTSGDMQLVHRHMVRILDVLDGSKYVKKDVPIGTALLVDPTSVTVGVLLGDATTPSYLGHIERHLRGILSSPGVTDEQVRLATGILESIQHIALELENVYDDVHTLVRMSNAALAQATGTLQDVATNASGAYAGGYASALSQTRNEGSKDLYIAFQKFSVFDIYTQ